MTQIGKYELQKKIGGGSFGEVFQALDLVLKRTVAIKLIKPELCRDLEFIRRFRREAAVAAQGMLMAERYPL